MQLIENKLLIFTKLNYKVCETCAPEFLNEVFLNKRVLVTA
jgi:hypothetical protein